MVGSGLLAVIEEVTYEIDPADAAALDALIAAERARREKETEDGIAAMLAGVPWPLRKVVTKGLGR